MPDYINWVAPVGAFLFIIVMAMMLLTAYGFGFSSMPHTEIKIGLRMLVPISVDELYTDETQAYLAEKISAVRIPSGAPTV